MAASEGNIKIIVDVLYKYEGSLSDGYDFYCGLDDPDAVNEMLEKIAKDILHDLSQSKKK